jgi:O-antigen biosynthesis protein
VKKWLYDDIWPKIKEKLPQAQLDVYGAYPQSQWLQLSNKEKGFFVRGFIPDVFPILRKYRISLSPLRFGAGLKG